MTVVGLHMNVSDELTSDLGSSGTATDTLEVQIPVPGGPVTEIPTLDEVGLTLLVILFALAGLALVRQRFGA